MSAYAALSEGYRHVFSYALIKSSLEMPACVQIVLKVEAFILG